MAGRYGPLCALQVNTPLSLVCLLVHLPLCKAFLALIVGKLMDSAGVESVPRATHITTPSKPVFFSSGLEVTSEHAAISLFPASSDPVQGTSCVGHAVSH